MRTCFREIGIQTGISRCECWIVVSQPTRGNESVSDLRGSGQPKERVHGSDEVPESLSVDHGGRLDIHNQVVEDGSHDSHLSVGVRLAHVGERGQTGRRQTFSVFQWTI